MSEQNDNGAHALSLDMGGSGKEHPKQHYRISSAYASLEVGAWLVGPYLDGQGQEALAVSVSVKG